MTAAHMMSSHGGPHDFPFGYEQQNIQGIGLPAFMNPPPPGQPLMSSRETQHFTTFLHEFDADTFNFSNHAPDQHELQNVGLHSEPYYPPPTFVGSETSYPSRSIVAPQHLQAKQYATGALGETAFETSIPDVSYGGSSHASADMYVSQHFNPHMANRMQSASASVTNMYNDSNTWGQISHQNMGPTHGPNGQPLVRYGSDAGFQPHRYVAPNGSVDTDIAQMANGDPTFFLNYNSATSTQPNTQPNTEPSSPVMTKKRKLNDYQEDQLMRRSNGFTNGHRVNTMCDSSPPTMSPARRRKSIVKHEHSPRKIQYAMSAPQANGLIKSSPIIDREPDDDDHDIDADAEAEPDDEASPPRQPDSSPPAPWSKGKPRPIRKPQPPPKPAKTRKSHTPLKPKSKPVRPSITTNQSSGSGRQTLTAAQKKANHTNSEQRRRDAQAKAYAQLYDLVPELEGMGKQSTFKKLEAVVGRLREVMNNNEVLKQRYEGITGTQWAGGNGGNGDQRYEPEAYDM